MLILSRKVGEAIAINEDVIVRVLEVKGGQVRLGVQAPNHVTVHREEIFLRILEENRKAAQEAPDDLTDVVKAFSQQSPAIMKKKKKTSSLESEDEG